MISLMAVVISDFPESDRQERGMLFSGRSCQSGWVGRSLLLSMVSVFVSSGSSIDRILSALSEESITRRINSALLIWLWLRWIPSFSIVSELSRIPAVSIKRTGKPLMLMTSSMVSRVVPAISLTMARSNPSRRLRRDDFPALGGPAMTVRIPSRRKWPCSAVARRASMRDAMSSRRSSRAFSESVSISSSGKSIQASTCAIKDIISCRIDSSSFPNRPSSCWLAAFMARSVFAVIRSIMASACVRSIFPLMKARWENSPGSADSAPA